MIAAVLGTNSSEFIEKTLGLMPLAIEKDLLKTCLAVLIVIVVDAHQVQAKYLGENLDSGSHMIPTWPTWLCLTIA